jgi:sugar phosphate permease
VYLQWLPTYLSEERQFSQLKVGLTASLPLLAATIANPIGGSVSDWLAGAWGLRRGRVSVLVAGFLVAAIALVPGVLSRDSSTALACLVVALAGLELTVAVSWAMCIDLGRQFSGSVSGVMNTGGNLGGACGAVVVGYMATLYGWTSVFVLASALCLAAAALALFLDPAAAPVPEAD